MLIKMLGELLSLLKCPNEIIMALKLMMTSN